MLDASICVALLVSSMLSNSPNIVSASGKHPRICVCCLCWHMARLKFWLKPYPNKICRPIDNAITLVCQHIFVTNSEISEQALINEWHLCRSKGALRCMRVMPSPQCHRLSVRASSSWTRTWAPSQQPLTTECESLSSCSLASASAAQYKAALPGMLSKHTCR